MLLSELLASAGLTCRVTGGDAEVIDVQVDSRRCRKGTCFVAVRGTNDDGHKYIGSAISAGASAIVCQDGSAVIGGAACALTGNTRPAAGLLAQAIRLWPARKLTCIGVTGTNGKTTVAHMIRSILAEASYDAGLLGTINYQTGRRDEPATTTTPDPVSLAELADEMVAAGKTHLVMEVSSHALDQDRAAGISFSVGVYTNLSGDHLDYHKDMETYLASKLRLFEQLEPRAAAIINRDDRYAELVAQATKARITWYGLNAAADLHARIERMDASGTHFTIVGGGRRVKVATPMIGRHNVQNCLAAAGSCLAIGIDLPTIAEALGRVSNVRGRLQRVQAEAPYSIFVDYAHTDDALRNVLSSLRPIVAGQLIVVFGCGGDRDRTKRPRMARVAEDLADRIVITSDNPRSEDPKAIIDEIVSGLSSTGLLKTNVQPDRRLAIESAINLAASGDAVLIAGKGHETYQVVGSRRRNFDDVKVAERAVKKRGARR